MSKIKYSIIIPTFNKLKEHLIPCIKSLLQFTDFTDKEIIIISNGCKDGTPLFINDINSPFIKCLSFKEALGYTKATNIGIKESSGKFIILLNNDNILLDQDKDQWIKMLEEPFLKDSSIGITGPLLSKCGFTKEDFIVFFCAMIKRDIFDSLGLLDESFNPGFGEDIDFCIRAKKKGFNLSIAPYQGVLSKIKDNNLFLSSPFPIYHTPSNTVNGLDNWEDIKKRNITHLLEKYIEEKKEDFKKQEPCVFDEIFNINTYGIERKDVENKIIVDIGGFNGLFAIKCHELNARKIYTFEANNNNFKLLINNISGYYEDKIIPYNLVVSNVSDEDYYITDKLSNSKIFKIPQNDSFKCKSISLDDIVENIVKEKDLDMILKIDCEGSEYDILYNSNKNNLKKFKYIVLEIHEDQEGINSDKRSIFELKKYISNLGYKEIYKSPPMGKWIYGEDKRIKDFIPLPVETVKFERIPNHSIFPLSTKSKVTATISTKDRYFSTLPSVIIAIANQTKPPDKLIIYDDGEKKEDLRSLSMYKNIFSFLNTKGIDWEVRFGLGIGQVFNHQNALESCNSKYIWRLDDDTVPEPDVLERLLYLIESQNEVGAVAGLVLEPQNNLLLDFKNYNKIEEIFDNKSLNCQWFNHKENKVKNVDHLYCSFLYKKDIIKNNYNLDLSPACHREETLFSYGIKKEGYSLLVDPSIKTWHFKESQGGIRAYSNIDFWEHDDNILRQNLIKWGVDKVSPFYIVLDCGIGDHVAFKNIFNEIKKKYKNPIIMALCYPYIFEDNKNDIHEIISIKEAQDRLKSNLEEYNIYKKMMMWNWEEHIIEAFRKMYL